MSKIKIKEKFSRGGWNLVLLGVISTLLTVVMTGISLAIYHNSGDIYLDRSRPGYLPDEEEIKDKEEGEQEYEFSKTGKITIEDIEGYLKNLDIEVKAVDAFDDPFNAEILSNEHLGITDKN